MRLDIKVNEGRIRQKLAQPLSYVPFTLRVTENTLNNKNYDFEDKDSRSFN